ncbi:hypothetical protein KKC94_05285, partial [Patescibacteria group bacterium]|nr:hypothetical protein [Patescibacteria group bacterium]
MAISCRHLNQDDPFKKRHLFVDETSSPQERLDTAKTNVEKISDTEIQATLNKKAEEIASKLPSDTQQMEELAALESTISYVQAMDAQIQNSPEKQQILKEMKAKLDDYKITPEELGELMKKLDLLRKNADEVMNLREAHLGDQKNAVIYFKLGENRLSTATTKDNFPIGQELTADFGFGEVPDAVANTAWSRTGLNNMVPTGIVEVKVTKTNGQVINAIRKDSELTGHFYDKMN